MRIDALGRLPRRCSRRSSRGPRRTPRPRPGCGPPPAVRPASPPRGPPLHRAARLSTAPPPFVRRSNSWLSKPCSPSPRTRASPRTPTRSPRRRRAEGRRGTGRSWRGCCTPPTYDARPAAARSTPPAGRGARPRRLLRRAHCAQKTVFRALGALVAAPPAPAPARAAALALAGAIAPPSHAGRAAAAGGSPPPLSAQEPPPGPAVSDFTPPVLTGHVLSLLPY